MESITAKEKAHELVSKCLGFAHSTRIETVALFCVDEIIKSWNEDGNKRLDAPVISYWESVKDEIKLLTSKK